MPTILEAPCARALRAAAVNAPAAAPWRKFRRFIGFGFLAQAVLPASPLYLASADPVSAPPTACSPRPDRSSTNHPTAPSAHSTVPSISSALHTTPPSASHPRARYWPPATQSYYSV